MDLLGLSCFTQRPTKFEQFKKDLNSVQLPNTLWALHFDPKNAFAAFLHLDPHSLSTITVDKSLVLTFDGGNIASRVYLNSEAVVVPELDLKIETVRELEHFLVMFEKLKLCKGNMPECRKLSKPGHGGDFCAKCSSSKVGCFDMLKQDRNFRFKGLGFSNDIKCEVCGKCFAEPSQLKEHCAIHLPKYSYNYPLYSRPEPVASYGTCGNLFCEERHADSRDRELKIHRRSQSYDNYQHSHKNSHREDKPHKCTICDKGFVCPKLVNLHRKKHTDDRLYTCSICGNNFDKKSHLNMHKKSHTNEKYFECPTCGKRFKTSGNLNAHKRLHLKELSCD